MLVTHSSRRLGDRIVHRARGELAQALHQAVAQIVARHALAGDADHAEVVGQQPGGGEIVERRDHQPMGQVAGGAEDHEGAGVRLLLIGERAPVWKGVCHDRPAFGLAMSGAGSGMLLRLLVAAEAVAHRREHLLGEGVLLARAEAREERGGQHLGRHRLVDRRLDGPAAFAGILDEAGVTARSVAILGQRRGGEVEQPGGDHAAAPPDLGDVGEVEVEAMLGRQRVDAGVASGCRSPRRRPASGRTRCRCGSS